MSSLLRSFLLYSIVLFAIFVTLQRPVTAQKVGDRVMVSANVNTKIYDKKVDKVFMGQIHTVVAVNGKWCALGNVKGWLPMRYVMGLKSAKQVYDARIKKNRNDADAWAFRGMIHYENDDYRQAGVDFTESLKYNAKNAATWNNRGMVNKMQANYPLAVSDFTQAIKLNPRYADAYYNLGLVYFELGNYERAINNYDKSLQLKPKHAWSYVNRGFAKQGKQDRVGAKRDFEMALKIDSNLAEPYIGLCNLSLDRDELAEALKHADKAVLKHPQNGMALNSRGWVRFKQGDLEGAMSDFNTAIRYAPRQSIIYNNRGVCFAAQNEFKKAIQDYSRAIALFPKSAVALANRGTAYMGYGDFRSARNDFEKAIKYAPKLSDAANSYAWFLATCSDEEYRDGQKAVQLANQACEMSDWKDWYHLDTLAAAFAERGDFDSAVKWANKALAAAPESDKEKCQDRLALFESKQPYRSDRGKTSAGHP